MFPSELKRIYELLSYGLTFLDRLRLQQLQLHHHLNLWLDGRGLEQIPLDRREVFTGGRVDGWHSRMIALVNLSRGSDYPDLLREWRREIHAGFTAIFERWRSEQMSFRARFRHEGMSWGRSVIEDLRNLTPENLFPSSMLILAQLQAAIGSAGLGDREAASTAIRYLSSEELLEIPFIKISAMFYAAIARKAAAGQKRPPSQGMVNDVDVVSLFLPYCDAMFLDNECAALLSEGPLKRELDYGTKIFCKNSGDEFLTFLDAIEERAPAGHLDKVREVYGPDWPKPFVTLFERNLGPA